MTTHAPSTPASNHARVGPVVGLSVLLLMGCGAGASSNAPPTPKNEAPPTAPSTAAVANTTKKRPEPPTITTAANQPKPSAATKPSAQASPTPKPSATAPAPPAKASTSAPAEPKPAVVQTYQRYPQPCKDGKSVIVATAVPAKLRIDGKADEWLHVGGASSSIAVDTKGVVLRLDAAAAKKGLHLLLGASYAPAVPELGWHVERDYTNTMRFSKYTCARRYEKPFFLPTWHEVGRTSPAVRKACLAQLARRTRLEQRYGESFRRALYIDKKGIWSLSRSGKKQAIEGAEFAAGAIIEARLPLSILPYLLTEWSQPNQATLWLQLRGDAPPTSWLTGAVPEESKSPMCGRLLTFPSVRFGAYPQLRQRIIQQWYHKADIFMRWPRRTLVSWHPSQPDRFRRLRSEPRFGATVGAVQLVEATSFKPIATEGAVTVGYLGGDDKVASLVKGQLKDTAPVTYFVRRGKELHFIHKLRDIRPANEWVGVSENLWRWCRLGRSMAQMGLPAVGMATWEVRRMKPDGSFESIADLKHRSGGGPKEGGCCDCPVPERQVRFFYDSDFQTLRIHYYRHPDVYRFTKRPIKTVKQTWRWNASKKRYILTFKDKVVLDPAGDAYRKILKKIMPGD